MNFEKQASPVRVIESPETPRTKELPPFSPELVRAGDVYELLYAAQHTMLPEDHPVTREVEQLLVNYPGSDKPTRLRVSSDTSSPNALVLPNGTIIVNKALLGLLDVEEMNMVIAHEVRHYRSRDAEEFTKAKREMDEYNNAEARKAKQLVGMMRMAEYRADIHGLIEGDEGGTHPAALRTLMQKLEKWRRENDPDASSGLIHGSEIERIVNAGMAAQVFDFSAEYQTRTSFSAEVRAFCAAETPVRFPDSGECEADEAEMAFAGASPLEILMCLRQWRVEDRRLAMEVKERERERLIEQIRDARGNVKKAQADLAALQVQNIEIPIVGDGYEVAVRHLEMRVKERLPAASEIQRNAVVHVLLESVARVSETELPDSPIAGILEYLDGIEDRQQLEEICDVLHPDTFQALGAACIDANGISHFTGAVFRAANESGAFEVEKAFDVNGYLDEARKYISATGSLLEQRSLIGKEGFTVSDTLLDELLFNIDVKKSHLAVVDAIVRFQESLMAAGLPTSAYKLVEAVRRQHYFDAFDGESDVPDEVWKEWNDPRLLGSSPYVLLLLKIYQNLHPFFRRSQANGYCNFVGLEMFRLDTMTIEVGQSETSSAKMSEYFFGKLSGFDPFYIVRNDVGDVDAKNGLAQGKTFLRCLGEAFNFQEVIGSEAGFEQFCDAMNVIDRDCSTAARLVSGHFDRALAIGICYLVLERERFPWLPQECDEAFFFLIEKMAKFPGNAVSNFLLDLDYFDHVTSIQKGSSDRLTERVFRLLEIILNHQGKDPRDPEAHLRHATRLASQETIPIFQGDVVVNRVVNDDLVSVLGQLKIAAVSDVVAGKGVTQNECLAMLERFDEIVFRVRRKVPLPVVTKDPSQDMDHEFATTLLRHYVRDLDKPIDRHILRRLSSHMQDPILRSRVCEAVVDRELAQGGLSPRQKIDLLWKDPHVRATPLGEVRERVVDTDVDRPEDLQYLRDLLLTGVEQRVSQDRMGVYAILERYERKKDAFELFRMAYEHSQDDSVAKRELFLLIRQDWSELGVRYTDEEAIIRTETVQQNLEAADPVLKHALIRKILIGERGLLHTPKDRKKLFAYLLDSGVDLKGSPVELVNVIREVLDVVAEAIETDILFMAIAPFLEDGLFVQKKATADWESILRDVYGSRVTALQTMKRVEGMRRGSTLFEDLDADTSNIEIHVVSHAQRLQLSLRALGINLDPRVQAVERPTLEAMVVRIAESMGADGVRFLQILGQYVEGLSPELERSFQDANDNVRGQPKLTARETMMRRAPGLRVKRMGRRLGGGSLMSPYDADVEEPLAEGGIAHEAVKVLAPNVEYISDTVEANLMKVVEGLVAKHGDRYLAAKQALEDISAWIRADIRDARFFELDPAFREQHSGFRVPGLRYGLHVPVSRPVDRDPKSPANRSVKREEFVNGMTLNRVFTDPQGHDVRHATALIAKSFAQQLVRGVMHSDVHPGNYMLFEKDGQEWVAMIDRSYYLELDAADQALILGLTQEGASSNERAQLMHAYFKERAPDTLSNDFWSSIGQVLESQGERGVRVVMARIRSAGIKVPLKLTLLLKNVHSVQRMCQRAGFTSFREALGYLPEVA